VKRKKIESVKLKGAFNVALPKLKGAFNVALPPTSGRQPYIAKRRQLTTPNEFELLFMTAY
jgi:hypothetical protein